VYRIFAPAINRHKNNINPEEHLEKCKHSGGGYGADRHGGATGRVHTTSDGPKSPHRSTQDPFLGAVKSSK
jgi:hypothetical protein